MKNNNFIIRSRAPLRLGLGGGGTDMEYYYSRYEGAVLNVTISLYAYCIIEPLNNKLVFNAIDLGEKSEHSTTELIEPVGTLKVHKAVYNYIIKRFNNNKSIPHKVSTYSDVPPGSGLGSSSTLTVAIIKAYTELLSLPFGDYDIANLAYEIEHFELGMDGGKQDQYATAFGGFNFIKFYKDDKVIVTPLKVKKWIMCELEQSLILFNTGVSRESSKIIAEQGKQIKGNNLQTIKAMHLIKEEATNIKNHLLMGEIEHMASSIKKGWMAKKNASTSISNAKIDNLYDKIIKAGALAGKISGAGGGGFMIFVTKPENRVNIIKALKKEKYGEIYNCHLSEEGARSWIIKIDR